MSRRFNLAEARALLPQVGRLLREVVSLKAEFQTAERAIQSFAGQISMMGGMAVDRQRAMSARQARDDAGTRLKAAIEAVQETGCLIKDLDTGLVDFPTMYRGREVYLCWRMDEPDIAFWHAVEDGFAGRKAIDADFLENHSGDRAH